MEADELLEFLETRMRMSHVYQPLLIRCLLDAGGQATVRQLAIEFSKEDEAQVRYYEDRIKKMPVDVLKGHGVVEETDGVVKLTVDGLTFALDGPTGIEVVANIDPGLVRDTLDAVR